jgi:hypothetical protein
LDGVEIPQDKHGCHLIELTHLIDAIWDAFDGCKELGIPPIDPETNREKKTAFERRHQNHVHRNPARRVVAGRARINREKTRPENSGA